MRSWKKLFSAPARLVMAVLVLSGAIAAEGARADDGGSCKRTATGQVLYVPAYSTINVASQTRKMPLTTTLSVHNIDPSTTIRVTSIAYYDTGGKLLREYAEAAIELSPLATRNVVIEALNRSGGVGASFLVTWEASKPVAKPAIEAVMVSSGTQGISFVSEGRVVSETP